MKNMWKALASVAIASALVIAPLAMGGASATGGEPNEGVCTGTHLSPTADGDLTTETYTAPEGFLISGYCVKAGSIVQGDGPEYFEVEPPAASITFGHSTGKEISHFSVTLVEIPDEEPTTVTATYSYTPPTCDAAGSLSFDEVEGVIWGAVLNDDGTTTFTASADEGFVLAAPVSFTALNDLDQLEGEQCEPDVLPLPALFAADPVPPTCDTQGGLPTVEELQAAFPNVSVSFDREFDGPGTYTLTVTPDPGYAFIAENVDPPWTLNPDGTASREVTVLDATGFQDDDPALPCFLAAPIVLGAPVASDPCGTANDTALLPPVQAGVTYSWQDEVGGNVIATVDEGVTVSDASLGWANVDGVFVYEFSASFTNVACPAGTPNTPGTPTTPTTALAATGGPNMAPWGIGAIAMMLAGISALAFRKVARR